MRKHQIKWRFRSRLQVATLAGGLVALLSAGISIASTVEQDDGGQEPSSVGGLYTPQIDPKRARQAAVEHLMSLGVPRDQATLRIRKQSGQVRAAAALRKQAPESVQSVWIDGNGTLMASVLDEAGEKAARAAGATPKSVTFATKDLEAAGDTLAQDAKDNPLPGFSGASFEIDPASGKLIAQYMFDGADPVVPAAATRLGDMVIASAKAGELSTKQDVDVGGASMSSVIGRNADELCTAAWAVDIVEGSVQHNGVMTAGHCFNNGDAQGTAYDIDTVAAGNTQAKGEFFSFGAAGDYGYLRLERDRGTTQIFNGNVIEAIEEPVPGLTVCKDGSTTGETCGEIKRVGVTIIAQNDRVNTLVKGQVRADFCSEGGDSGAPVYMDFDQAKGPLGIAGLGVLSSGKTSPGGSCETYFTPLSGIDPQGKFFVRIDGG